MKPPTTEIGERLDECLDGKSIAWLTGRSGVSSPTLYRLRSEERTKKGLSIGTLERVARALNVSPGWLAFGTGPKEAVHPDAKYGEIAAKARKDWADALRAHGFVAALPSVTTHESLSLRRALFTNGPRPGGMVAVGNPWAWRQIELIGELDGTDGLLWEWKEKS